MTSEEYFFKTRPAWFFLAFMFVAGSICVWVAYQLWYHMPVKPNNGTGSSADMIAKIVFTCFFALFGLLCFSLIIGLKICYLTSNELIITRPLLFYKHIIRRADIRNISEKDSNIDVDRTGFSRDLVKIGNTSILLLKNGKKVQISSVNVGHYRELMKKLSHRA